MKSRAEMKVRKRVKFREVSEVLIRDLRKVKFTKVNSRKCSEEQ